jgi:hypothetical protein
MDVADRLHVPEITTVCAFLVAFAQRFSRMLAYESFAAHVMHCANESAERPIAHVLMLIRDGMRQRLYQAR